MSRNDFGDFDLIRKAYALSDEGETSPTVIGRKINAPEKSVRRWLEPATRERIEKDLAIQYLYETLEERKIDPREVNIKSARIQKGDWDVTAKIKEVGPNGEKIQRLVTTNNKRKGVEIVLSPKFAEGPKWPVVDRGPSIILRKPAPRPKPKRDWKLALLGSDEQLFFWRDLHTEKWVAGHDERVMDIFLQVAEDFQPDRIIDGGDLVDNPEWSNKFRKHPEFAFSTQRAVNRGTLWIAQMRQAAPDAEIDEIEGNHDARIRNFIIDNAGAAHGLTRGYDQRKPMFREQPVLSMPYLLWMEKHGVRYSAAFPGGDVWLNDWIVFAHENNSILKEERASLFHGHDHKKHETWITVHHRGKQVRRAVVGVGTMARTDEIIDNLERSMRSHIPANSVRQNWQQGFSLVYYDPKGGPGDFSHVPVHVINGVARIGEKIYKARPRTLEGYLKETRKSAA